MSVMPSPANGHAVAPAPDEREDLLARVRLGPSDDAHLFALFADLARAAGREDLCTELSRRATGPTVPVASVPAPRVNVRAEARHKDGCRLVRDGKLAEAEVAFRDAI